MSKLPKDGEKMEGDHSYSQYLKNRLQSETGPSSHVRKAVARNTDAKRVYVFLCDRYPFEYLLVFSFYPSEKRMAESLALRDYVIKDRLASFPYSPGMVLSVKAECCCEQYPSLSISSSQPSLDVNLLDISDRDVKFALMGTGACGIAVTATLEFSYSCEAEGIEGKLPLNVDVRSSSPPHTGPVAALIYGSNGKVEITRSDVKIVCGGSGSA